MMSNRKIGGEQGEEANVAEWEAKSDEESMKGENVKSEKMECEEEG